MKIKRVEHVAIAVRDMQSTMNMLESTFGLKLDYVEDRGTSRLAMYPVGETSLELLQAIGPNSRITDWITARGQGLWHLCFEVEDIDSALVELRDKGVKLLDQVPREGHGGCRIAFIDPESTGDVLIELAELQPPHG